MNIAKHLKTAPALTGNLDWKMSLVPKVQNGNKCKLTLNERKTNSEYREDKLK